MLGVQAAMPAMSCNHRNTQYSNLTRSGSQRDSASFAKGQSSEHPRPECYQHRIAGPTYISNLRCHSGQIPCPVFSFGNHHSMPAERHNYATSVFVRQSSCHRKRVCFISNHSQCFHLICLDQRDVAVV